MEKQHLVMLWKQQIYLCMQLTNIRIWDCKIKTTAIQSE